MRTQALNRRRVALECRAARFAARILASALRAATRIAALYAVEAEAYDILELDARGAVLRPRRALPLVPTDPRSGAPRAAHGLYAANVYDNAGIAAAIQTIETARASQRRGSPADTCLLITRGLLEHRQGRDDLAIVTLTQAYRASGAPAVPNRTSCPPTTLSLVMRSMGDYSQALALNQEKIDWDTAHGATMSLSVSRFMRGQILKLMGNYAAAIAEFEQGAQAQSVTLDDQQGVAFADQRICEAHIELGELERGPARNARAPCAPSAPPTPPTR